VQRKTYETDPRGPLLGTRVLDMSRLVAGNMLTHILADFGSEVLKIERPLKGDDLRNWQVQNLSLFWKVYARNKKSVTLDLRKAEVRDILLHLVESAHILVENFVPGTLEKWGLGPDVLLARNPRLIVVRISGWGQTGIYRERPGFGSLIEGMSGFASLNGFADRPPVLPPLALADMVAGYSGACACMMALREAEKPDGAGQVIDLSLFDPLFATLGPAAAAYRVTGEVPPRTGSRSTLSCPRNVYLCRDGKYVCLSASVQAVAERLFEAIGRPELIKDPRFATNEARVRHDDLLDPIVAAFVAAMSQEEALAYFAGADVTVGPVLDISDLVDHPYIADRAILSEYPDDEIGFLPMHHVSPQFSRTPGAIHSAAPSLGQHTLEVLTRLGVTEEAIDALRHEGIV
jgi:formyl-CoA transferase